MLTITTANGVQAIQCDDYYVRELASGYDELIFTISIYDPLYPLIQEEASIVEKSDLTTKNTYLVKAIDAGNTEATVKAQIDLDEWKTSMTIDYSSSSTTVAGMLTAVKPSGWAVIDQSGLTYSRTIHLDYATPLDVLEQCRSTFSGVTFRFNNTLRTVTIVNMNTITSIGAFATKELNLKENNYKGKSTGFVTRLYAYGKDGMSFADINSGKAYVDCHDYSNRVICGYWKDERYTIKENLLAAAQAKVNTLGVPQRSYECDVVDLAAVDPSRWGYLDFTLFTTMTLIDDTRASTGVKHQVVERWIYPNMPHKNKVVLSSTAPKLQSQVSQILDSFSNPNSELAQQQASMQADAIARATAQITGATGGYMRNIYDANGKWIEQVIMDTEDILTATKVWRWNMGGLGYSSTGYNGSYGTAITQNGEIVASYITTGTLNAALAEIINLNASNISTGTLSADRIAAHSLAVNKITGNMTGGLSSSWGIDFDTGTLTIGNISAANITAGTLSADRIGANTITIAKLATAAQQKLSSSEQLIYISKASGTTSVTAPSSWITDTTGNQNTWTLKRPTYNGSYPVLFVATQRKDANDGLTCTTPQIDNTTTVIDGGHITTGTIDASVVSVTKLNASNITTGTLSADRIAANSIAVGKLTGSITGGLSNSWEINLTNGTMTVGNISASNITTGTLNASTITVTNLNADNITAGTLNVARIGDGTITGTKIGTNTITGGSLGNLGLSTITSGNIGSYEITGGSYGNLDLDTITTGNCVSGINTSLGYADFSNSVFNNGTRCSYMYCDYLDVGTTGRINAFSATSLSVYYGGAYYSATFQTPSVSLTHSSAFKVVDTNGNEQWVSNTTAASLGSYVLAH